MNASYKSKQKSEGLQIHCKCIYSLDKAGQLAKRKDLMEVFDSIFSAYFAKVAPSNQVNLGNIFAKN